MKEKQHGLLLRPGHPDPEADGQDHGHRADGGHAGLQAGHPRRRHHHAHRDEELKEDITTDEVVRKLRGPKGTPGHDHDPARRLRRADPDDDHARRDPDASRCATPSCSSPDVGYIMLSRLHAHLQPRARRGHREAREAGHEEAAVRPARQPGRRPRAGRRRQPTSSCRRARWSSTRAGRTRLLGAGVLRARRRRRTSTSRSSCSSTAARPRPPRSSPAPSRTTTAASSSASARGARASSRASTRCPTARASR